MTFRQNTEEYYEKFIELQEKLRKSEGERLKLEMKFNEMMQVTREEEQLYYRRLRSQYKHFLEENRKRQDRNDRILRLLERIESRAAILEAKTQRFQLLRKQYQSYMNRIYTRQESSRQTENIPTLKPPEKPEDLLGKYLRSMEHTQLPSENTIADEIMQSIYNRERYRNNNNNRGSNSGYPKSDVYNQEKIDDNNDYTASYLSGDGDRSKYLGGGDYYRKPNEQKNHLDKEVKNLSNGYLKDDHFVSNANSQYNLDPIPQNNLMQPLAKSAQLDDINNIQLHNAEELNRTPENKITQNKAQVDDSNKNDMEKLNQNQSKILEKAIESVEINPVAQEQQSANAELTTQVNQKIESENNVPIQLNDNKQEIPNVETIKSDKKEHYDENVESVLPEQQSKSPIQCDDNGQPLSHLSYTVNENNGKTEINDEQDQLIQNVTETTENSKTTEDIANDQDILFVENGKPIHSEKPIEQEIEQPMLSTDENELPVQNNEQQLQYDPNQSQYDENGQAIQYDENGQVIPSTQDLQYDENGQPIHYDENGQQMQYDENGQQIQYDQNGQSIQYDANGQPIQYDANGQPIHYDEHGQQINYDESGQQIQYDENGQAIQYDENGKPMQYDANNSQQQQYDENGQPIQYDENGQAVPYDPNTQTQQYDENGQPIQYDETEQAIPYDPNTQTQQYDKDGQPIQYDENGQPITQLQQYDENGQPIQYDENGQVKPFDPNNIQYDENGQPIQYDENGQQVQYDANGQPIQYDENGQPIQYDENGQQIQYDANGQQIQYDENGQQIQYDANGQQIQYDANGQPIQYDENGQPIQYDQNGQQIQYDENGQPIYAESQPDDTDTGAETSEITFQESDKVVEDEKKKANVLELLETDSESVKQDTNKVSNDSDFDFSNN